MTGRDVFDLAELTTAAQPSAGTVDLAALVADYERRGPWTPPAPRPPAATEEPDEHGYTKARLGGMTCEQVNNIANRVAHYERPWWQRMVRRRPARWQG